MNWHQLIGISAGVIQIISVVPYIRDMVHGTTRPNTVSYGIWAILAIIEVSAQLSSGASWSVIVLIAIACNTTLITILSLVGYGYRKYGTLDWTCLCLALIAVGLWYVTKDPFIGLLTALSANVISTIPTIIKTYHEPASELPLSWFLACVAAILSLLSSQIWNVTNLILPAYFLFESIVITLLALRYRRR